MAQNNPTIAPKKILPILNPNDVDIENYLIIDPKTGRKSINTAVDNRMNEFFNTLHNPLDHSPLVLQCFGETNWPKYQKIEQKFHQLGREYTHVM